jgi:hypothetical protein
MGVRYWPRATATRPFLVTALAATRCIGTGAQCRLVSLFGGMTRGHGHAPSSGQDGHCARGQRTQDRRRAGR